MNAAVWSAIAATFAGFSSFAILLVQRAKYFEDVKPELVLAVWSREEREVGGRPCSVIKIGQISNVGKGSALHLYMNALEVAEDDRPMSASSSRMIDLIPVNESRELNQEITVFWNNVNRNASDIKLHTINLDIFCHDTIGKHLHHTKYEISVFSNNAIFGGDTVASGVAIRRTVHKENISIRKIQSKLSK